MLAKNTIMQSLLIYSDMVVFGGTNIQTKPHAHHALEIILTKELPMTVIHQGKRYSTKGIIIQSDVKHQICGEGIAIFLYVDPESVFARQFNLVLKAQQLVVLADEISLRLIDFLSRGIRENVLESTVKDYLHETFFSHHPLYSFNISVDDRISNVISFIRQNLGGNMAMKKLTEEACLSESRLFHLFKKEIGIPIRKYILWCRIRQATQLVIEGNSLTHAAQVAGFADIAHLTRTFVSFFGVSPSHVLKSTP